MATSSQNRVTRREAADLRTAIETADADELRVLALGALKTYRIIDDAFRRRFPTEAKALRRQLAGVTVSLFAFEQGRG